MAKTIEVKILGDNKGLHKALSDSESRVGSWAGTIGKIGLAAGAAVVGGTVAAGVGLFKLGSNFDAELDKIRVGTGATGDQLAGLSDSFNNVLTGNNRANFDTAGTAIADLNTRLGISGEELEALSGQFINLSDITGTDLTGNIDNITRVFGDWGISTGDQAESLDQVYRAAQASGIGIDDLSGSVVQFGAPLRNLGFGFEDSLALLAQFNKTGVNTETVFAGLKAGVGKLAKDGEDVPATFRRIVEEIETLGPGSEATALAIELFGQRAGPDLADAIAGGKFEIEEMLGAITDGEDTINDAARDTEDFGEKWNGIKNRVFVGLRPLAEQVFDGIGKAMDKLGPVIERLSAWLSVNLPLAAAAVQAWFEENWPKIRAVMQAVFDWLVNDAWPVAKQVLEAIQTVADAVVVWFRENWPTIQATIAAVVDWLRDEAWPVVQEILGFIRTEFESLVGWVRENWPEIRETIQNVIEAVRVIVETTIEAIRVAWETWGDTLVEYVAKAWESIKTLIQVAIDIVRGIINTVTGLITGDWDQAWEGIKTILSGAWDAIKVIVQVAIDGVKLILQLAWDAIGDYVSDTWDSITSSVSSGIDDIMVYVAGIPGRVARAIGNGFESIWTSFKSVANRIIDGWNGLEFTMPSINTRIPGVGTVGGFTVGVPDIPRLATGAVVSAPMLALVGEYAGARTNPEIVAPRSMMLDTMREALATSPSAGNVYHIHIDGAVNDESTLQVFQRRLDEIERRKRGAA